MFDKAFFIEAMDGCKRPGDTVFVPFDGLSPQELRAQIGVALTVWCSKVGAGAAITEETGDGVVVMLADLRPGSPKRSRKNQPWFYMDVGESRFVSELDFHIPSLRVYVSQFAAKMGQQITVKAKKGGCTITRTK